MASLTHNLSSKQWLGSVLMGLGIVLVSSPSLAQLPALPPAPPAPPASPPDNSPTPADDPAETEAPTDSEAAEPEATFIRPQTACPQNFDSLSALLLRDLPSYTNRILQSSVADIPTAYRPTYVITASQPEQTPLEIKDRVYTTNSDSGETLKQLFFTTLERQYTGLEATSIEHFHWLFLAPSEDSWEMVFMFSAIGGEDELIPPRDSSQGSVGQAIRRWLKDCKANAIFSE